MCNGSHSKDLVSGGTSQFHGYDFVIDSGKIRQSKNLVHRESKDICPRSNSLNRTPHINRSSCPSSKTPYPVAEISATGSDKSFKNFKIIHEDFRIIKGGTTGAGLVGTESGTLQWESYNSANRSCSYTNRRLQEGLGRSLSGAMNWGNMVMSGGGSSHQRSGTLSHTTWPIVFPQDERKSVLSPTSRQHNCSELFNENGGSQIPSYDKNLKRDMEIFTSSSDHDYCRIPARNFEHRGRLGVKEYKGLLGVDVSSSDLQVHLSNEG